MPNNTISQVVVNNTTYDLLDANTLSAVSALKERVSTLESSVVATKDITIVTGTSLYIDHYYGETSPGVSSDKLISLTVVYVTDNHPAYVVLISGGAVRAYTDRQSITVKVRVVYYAY